MTQNSQIIKALDTRIVGKPFEIAVQTESGIICDPQQLPQSYMTVISVGPDVNGVEINDIVMGPRHGGQTIVHNGTMYRVYDKNEIYGVLNDKNIKVDNEPILHTV